MSSHSDNSEFFEYHICVRGHLDSKWSDWFHGFTIEYTANNSVLRGSVPDQATLHGLLAKIRDLGLVLLRVELIDKKI